MTPEQFHQYQTFGRPWLDILLILLLIMMTFLMVRVQKDLRSYLRQAAGRASWFGRKVSRLKWQVWTVDKKHGGVLIHMAAEKDLKDEATIFFPEGHPDLERLSQLGLFTSIEFQYLESPLTFDEDYERSMYLRLK